MSQGELKLNYLRKPYIITMQTFQMALLLMFEKANSMTCRELMDATKLNPDHFQKYIQSLVESKLLCVAGAAASSAQTFEPTTVVSLNLEYNNKRTKFRITAAVQKETVQETEQTHSSVDEDRKLYLQVTFP